ncbi:MAG: PDZ domain-containing protein [Proteobacteria bacterium]|jgi:regulator of sigma E protease|nr:PDZ domain-containing protein [Pseudomonadota bacterium]
MELVLSYLLPIVAGLAMIAVLVVAHEFGHFVAAKLFNIGVPVFSVGIGPRLFGLNFRGTDYRVSLLPVGGYVRMSGADPFGEPDEDAFVDPETDFMKKPVWQRLIVMVAGPGFNLGLPFVLFTALLMLGEPQADVVVGTVMPSSPGEHAGFLPDDRVVAVGGEEVEVWAELVSALDERALEPQIPIDIIRDGQPLQLTLGPGAVRFSIDGMVDMEKVGIWASRLSTRIGVDDPTSPAWQAGLRTGDAIVSVDGQVVETLAELKQELSGVNKAEITYLRIQDSELVEGKASLVSASWHPRHDDDLVDSFGLLPSVLFVGSVNEESPANTLGVLADDRVYSVDGKPVRAWSDLLRYVADTVPEEGAEPRPLDLVLIREGQRLTIELTPEIQRDVVRGQVRYRPIMGIGIYPDAFVSGPIVKKYYSIVEAVPRATSEGMMVFTHTLSVLGNLFTGKLKPKESIGGPIEIFRMAGAAASRGIFDYARMIGIISFSLGILNLLPVPVLDGGQIFFYAIEGIRGRPLSIEFREKVQMIGVVGLVAVMLLVSVMDVSRWLGG